jgi:hypothetical protein
MIKTELAPGLRSLGFTGSGRNYDLGWAEHWAMLGLQASQWSDRERLTFTINLLVVSRKVWAQQREEHAFLGAKPAPNIHPGPFAWHERIGMVMPDNLDTWWEVRAGGNTEPVAREALEAVEVYGLPAMREAAGGSEPNPLL